MDSDFGQEAKEAVVRDDVLMAYLQFDFFLEVSVKIENDRFFAFLLQKHSEKFERSVAFEKNPIDRM